MTRVLSNRLAAVADTQEELMRERIHAALRIGAELALARVYEIGGQYAGSSDIRTAVDELQYAMPAPPTTVYSGAETPPSAPSPVDEIKF